jgi:hypothetical protein
MDLNKIRGKIIFRYATAFNSISGFQNCTRYHCTTQCKTKRCACRATTSTRLLFLSVIVVYHGTIKIKIMIYSN